MSQNQESQNPAEVALIFPPLVNTSFGKYFPSTAVLAAYLTANGIGSWQEDLNELFALYLLREDMLGRIAQGEQPGNAAGAGDSMASIAARLLQRHRNLLFDAAGRHRFRNDIPGPAHLLQALAAPYLVDLPLSALVQEPLERWPLADFYSEFYQWSGFIRDLPESVHLLGISLPMAAQLVPALFLARHVRQQRPGIRIILGGPTISLMSSPDLETLLENFHDIDAVVRFDGERPLEALAQQSRNGRWDISGIGGVSGRDRTGIVHTPPQPGLRLDDLPFAEYEPRLVSRLPNPEIGIIQARGCYWGECSYCDFVELYDGSPSYRTRTARRVVDEMEYQMRVHGARDFGIITEAIPPAFSHHMSQEILARGLDLQWSSFAMVERRFTPELFGMMVASGCEYLVIGLETMTDRVLKLVSKAATSRENADFLLSARSAGIRIHINLIPDLPTTTYDEAMGALEYLRELRDCFQTVGIFPFEATRSSAVGREPARFGLQVVQIEGLSGQAQNTINHLEVIDPGMSRTERSAVHAAYWDFAEEITQQQIYHPLFSYSDAGDDPEFQFAGDYLDIRHAANGTQCYHWVTRRLFHMPVVWRGIINHIRSLGPFRKEDFIGCFQDSAIAGTMFDQMLEYRLLQINSPASGGSLDEYLVASSI